MDDDVKLQDEMFRASQAKRILDDPLVKDSFEKLEKELIEGLLATAADDSARREKIHMMLVYGRKWRNTFASMIETGKLADMQLQERRKFKLWSRNG